MGRRAVTFKIAEKRPKNWNPEHRESFIKGLRLICKNDKKFLKKIKWDFDKFPNPNFKVSNLIHIDTTKISNKVWNSTRSRGLAGNRAVEQKTQEKRIPGGSAFNGIWPGDADVPLYFLSLRILSVTLVIMPSWSLIIPSANI